MPSAGISETVERLVVPSGPVTSNSVTGPAKIPRFSTGIENTSESPGTALKPTAEFKITVVPSRVRSTETPCPFGL